MSLYDVTSHCHEIDEVKLKVECEGVLAQGTRGNT